MAKLEQQDYAMGLQTQNARNLGALALDLYDVIQKVWCEAQEKGLGTDYVNHHPLVFLYIFQMAYLAGASDGIGTEEVQKRWADSFYQVRQLAEAIPVKEDN